MPQRAQSIDLHAVSGSPRRAVPSAAAARRRLSPSHPAAERSFDAVRWEPASRSVIASSTRATLYPRSYALRARRFHSDTCRNAREHDLRAPAPAQFAVEIRAEEGSPSLLCNQDVAHLRPEFRHDFGPTIWKRSIPGTGAGPAPAPFRTRSPARRAGRGREKHGQLPRYAPRSRLTGWTVGKPTIAFCRSIAIRAHLSIQSCKRRRVPSFRLSDDSFSARRFMIRAAATEFPVPGRQAGKQPAASRVPFRIACALADFCPFDCELNIDLTAVGGMRPTLHHA